MSPGDLTRKIQELVPALLDTARKLTWNEIAANCRFILSEIGNTDGNFDVQRRLRKKENDRKRPVLLQELVPVLQELYENLYDVNLYIYKAKKQWTVIDIRYYPKSSLDPEYRQKVLHNPPMLHTRISQPPWLTDGKGKFDVNWEHKQYLISWRLFWVRRKLSLESRRT